MRCRRYLQRAARAIQRYERRRCARSSETQDCYLEGETYVGGLERVFCVGARCDEDNWMFSERDEAAFLDHGDQSVRSGKLSRPKTPGFVAAIGWASYDCLAGSFSWWLRVHRDEAGWAHSGEGWYDAERAPWMSAFSSPLRVAALSLGGHTAYIDEDVVSATSTIYPDSSPTAQRYARQRLRGAVERCMADLK